MALQDCNRAPSPLSVISSTPPIDYTLDYTDTENKHSLFNYRSNSFRRVSIPENAAATISFTNINYAIGNAAKTHERWSKCSPLRCLTSRKPKQILCDVSGKFSNGMNAILGPSGCGKSSLLDVLADRKDPRGLSGQVEIDGLPRHPSFKYTIGYVVQDDICSGTLTVRENLFFSIHLRLPNDVSNDEKTDRVSQVIAELGLEACADTRVGTEYLRGVSGGEKRRTCIGMELVLSPKILFLDEPTTGLDATTAGNVMSCLKELSRRGRTIIFSIHQPRYSIFKLFDTVMLMSKGRCVYHDSTTHVIPHFAKHGYPCELHDNPADYALDVLIDIGRKPEVLALLNNTYNATYSNAWQSTRDRYHYNGSKRLEYDLQGLHVKAARSFGAELYYLSRRAFLNAVRNPALALVQIVVSIIMGLLVGLLFFDLKRTIEPGVQNRLGAIFFIIISQIFSNMTAIEPLVKERALFIHEHASGYYRISTYFLSKVLCDILPMRIVPSFLFSVISYFMIGFTRTGAQFFFFLLTVFISSLFGSAMCFFLSATISVFALALIVTILVLVVMMMFSGFLIDLKSIFPWLSWIQWISAFRYASDAIAINEFQGLIFCVANNTEICPMTGEDVLGKRGLDHANAWDLWKNIVALTIMAILCFALSYVQLVRAKKTK